MAHLLVLGDKRGTAWVLREARTAFARERVRDAKGVPTGGRLLLYASTTAFGGHSGLFGIATATRQVAYLDQPFRINMKQYDADMPLRFERLTAFRDFVDLKPLVDQLAIFRGNTDNWGVYLRRPLLELTDADEQTLLSALEGRLRPVDSVLPDYLAAS